MVKEKKRTVQRQSVVKEKTDDSLTSKAWLKRKRGQFNVISMVKEKTEDSLTSKAWLKWLK